MPTLANGHQWRYRVIVRWVDLGTVNSPLVESLAQCAMREVKSLPTSARRRPCTGAILFRDGFTIEQVVRDYGDVCQAVRSLPLIPERRYQLMNFAPLIGVLIMQLLVQLPSTQTIPQLSFWTHTQHSGHISHVSGTDPFKWSGRQDSNLRPLAPHGFSGRNGMQRCYGLHRLIYYKSLIS